MQGSGATNFFCSKCFLDRQKQAGCQEVIRTESLAAQVTPVEMEPELMDVESNVESTPVEVSVVLPTLKKKGKKTSYKAMMAAMTKASEDRDIEKEKEKLRKVTGGGAFSKIDKI
jgi:predicted ATP-dependent serine protease